MVSGKSSKAVRKARSAVVTKRSVPWGTVGGVAVVLLVAVVVFGYVIIQSNAKAARQEALAQYTPSAANQDPSRQIPGIAVVNYQGGQHVTRDQQVAYTHSPPFGGTHDQFWAECNGTVYPQPVRSENLVHSLEHGAVWIAYNPDQVSGDALDTLQAKVESQPYTVMSPYPGLDSPISVQAWAHQLKLTAADDIRIDQFVQALRTNQYTHPEVGASCTASDPAAFDPENPPPFVAAPPVSGVNGTTVISETEGSAAATPDAGTITTPTPGP